MKIDQSEIQGVKLLTIEGEVDLNSSPQLREVFCGLIAKGETKFIVDFKSVSYVDSSGLATLIEMVQRLKKNQGTVSLIQLSDKVRNLFEITKLDKLFKIYNTQEEAMAAAE